MRIALNLMHHAIMLFEPDAVHDHLLVLEQCLPDRFSFARSLASFAHNPVLSSQ